MTSRVSAVPRCIQHQITNQNTAYYTSYSIFIIKIFDVFQDGVLEFKMLHVRANLESSLEGRDGEQSQILLFLSIAHQIHIHQLLYLQQADTHIAI